MKNKNEQYKRIFRFLIKIVLILSQTGVFAYAWLSYYNDLIVVPFVQKGNWFFYLVYTILLSIFLNSFDGLKYGTYRKTNIMLSQVLASLATAFIIYLQIVLLAAEFLSIVPLIYMLIADVGIIYLLCVGGETLMQKLFPKRRVLLIYDEYSPEPFVDKMKNRKDKFQIENTVNVNIGFEEIEKLVAKAESVILYDIHAETRNKILKCCFQHDVRVYSTTKISDVLVRGAECVHIFDTPLLLSRNIGLSFEQRLLKRTMDILVSAIMLIITSPIFLISALAIKLYDGGPVFFRQNRGTIGGKVFRIHKFRSMIVDAEKDGLSHPAEQEDTRITPVGKVLRACRMDELPQLIDVLMGNMSLVGPRPERVEHIKQYTEEIPEFEFRLKVRGGITGYAQLYGKYNTSAYDKLQLDLMYIENYSFSLDIKLLLMTVKILFIRESTEGFSKKKSREMREKSKEK